MAVGEGRCASLLLLLRVRGAFGRPGLGFPAGVYYKHKISEISPGRQNHSKSLFFLGPEASGGHFVGGTPCRGRASRLPFPSTSYHACVALSVPIKIGVSIAIAIGFVLLIFLFWEGPPGARISGWSLL